MNDTEEQPEKSSKSSSEAPHPVELVLGCSTMLVLPFLVYIGMLWITGILANVELTWGLATIGYIGTLIITGVITIMGESLIEDIVKGIILFSFIPFALSQSSYIMAAYILIIPSGTVIPLGMRIFQIIKDRF